MGASQPAAISGDAPAAGAGKPEQQAHHYADNAYWQLIHGALRRWIADLGIERGRALEIGCGLGLMQDLVDDYVGIDIARYPARHMRKPFAICSGTRLPFPDDSFDVVLSWGSVEHIAGGYLQALREMKRVLRPDGLLMMHPGLYYSNAGHHLGEFSSEPHFHLKKPPEEIRRIVFEAPMNLMERAGHVATREEYWQWFKELNPITVAGFEQELRALGFQPWRVALRTEPLIEYTPEIYHFPMQDLATGEVYISCLNHKARR